MHTVSAEVDRLIQQLLATGQYSNPDTLLLEALHALVDQQDSVAAIRSGQEDVRAGKTRPWREAIADAKVKHSLLD